MKNNRIIKLTTLGLLTALVIILQLFVQIRLGMFSLSTVLIPIVVGASLFGVAAGTWLGLVFGAVVLFSGDAAFFMGLNAPGTIILVLAKGIACGAAAGAVYRLMYEKKGSRTAGIAAAVTAPVVNTLVFIIGCLIFFDYNMKYVLTAFVGVNFFIELAFNILLSSVILFLIKTGKSSLYSGGSKKQP